MKTGILLIFILLCISCKENKNINYEKKSNQYYNKILKEIETSDISKYFITYQIVSGLDTLDSFKKEFKKIKENSKNFLTLKNNFNLSKKNKEIIKNSLVNWQKKIELKYYFSPPYLLKDSTVVILNETVFKKGKIIKGGGSRIFYLKEDNIIKVENLKDF